MQRYHYGVPQNISMAPDTPISRNDGAEVEAREADPAAAADHPAADVEVGLVAAPTHHHLIPAVERAMVPVPLLHTVVDIQAAPPCHTLQEPSHQLEA